MGYYPPPRPLNFKEWIDAGKRDIAFEKWLSIGKWRNPVFLLEVILVSILIGILFYA